MNNDNNNNNLLSTKQVAAILDVGTSTVIRMVHRGDLDGHKATPALNSPMRITQSSVARVLKARQVTPEPETE
jgi:Transposase and inactivated derivatives